jgi:preprotein translocase subunit SecA
MKAFDNMWKGIAHQVTGSIFRMDRESPGFVGSLWHITSTTHAPPTSVIEEQQQHPGPGAEDGQKPDDPSDKPKAIEPIRHRGERVGRNDPCPCKSGKKFKHCCMKRS